MVNLTVGSGGRCDGEPPTSEHVDVKLSRGPYTDILLFILSVPVYKLQVALNKIIK